jgi:hypothetical protein
MWKGTYALVAWHCPIIEVPGRAQMPGAVNRHDAKDLLGKRDRELVRLRAARDGKDVAFNFFVTAEHMLDWVYRGSYSETETVTPRWWAALRAFFVHRQATLRRRIGLFG